MLCRWLLIGPSFSVALVAVALVVVDGKVSGMWCSAVTICHACI